MMKTMLKQTLFAGLAATLALALTAAAGAQAPTATVHGHVNNPAGQVMAGADVKFTTDKTSDAKTRKYPFVTKTDAQGNYSQSGLPAGDYLVVIQQGDTQADYQLITLKAGDDKTLDFDMTRPEYIKGMSPEALKQLEEYKKKNAAVVNANQVIAKLNATLKTVRADLAAAAPTKADVSTDVASMKEAVDAKADVGLLWLTYGDTLLAQADHLAADDKKAGKPAMSDDAVLQEYDSAAAAYKKGIDLDAAQTKPNLAEAAIGYNQMGTALAREGKTADAAASFEGAVKDDPTKAGMYYKNEAVVLFNSNQNDGALDAANKAIAADPNGPDPYWIKGQILIARSTFDQKTQKLTAPPGCVEAYNKFLQLAPDDPKAQGVREVLSSLGEKIDLNYKKGKK